MNTRSIDQFLFKKFYSKLVNKLNYIVSRITN